MNPRWLNIACFTLIVLFLSACGGQTAVTPTNAPGPAAPATAAPPTPGSSDQSTPAAGSSENGFSDPFDYCAAVGTIDEADARYSGPKTPEAIITGLRDALKLPPGVGTETFADMTAWRCAKGRVLACNRAIHNSCNVKADTSRTPSPGLAHFCQGSPTFDFIPPAVVRESIYDWRCNNGVPEVIKERTQPDEQGYATDKWFEITPQ